MEVSAKRLEMLASQEHVAVEGVPTLQVDMNASAHLENLVNFREIFSNGII